MGEAILAGLIGIVVAAGELIAIHKDAPWRSLINLNSLLFAGINYLAALCASFSLQNLAPHGFFGQVPDGSNLDVVRLLAAGFGAMLVLRSSFFTLRTSDGDIPIGPAILIQRFLDASSRAVDRSMATWRDVTTAQIMSGVDFDRAKTELVPYCLGLMAKLSAEEQKALARQLDELSKQQINGVSRSLLLGVSLMAIVGESVLRSAVKTLALTPPAARPPGP